jgi:hypothetical protein
VDYQYEWDEHTEILQFAPSPIPMLMELMVDEAAAIAVPELAMLVAIVLVPMSILVSKSINFQGHE